MTCTNVGGPQNQQQVQQAPGVQGVPGLQMAPAVAPTIPALAVGAAPAVTTLMHTGRKAVVEEAKTVAEMTVEKIRELLAGAAIDFWGLTNTPKAITITVIAMGKVVFRLLWKCDGVLVNDIYAGDGEIGEEVQHLLDLVHRKAKVKVGTTEKELGVEKARFLAKKLIKLVEDEGVLQVIYDHDEAQEDETKEVAGDDGDKLVKAVGNLGKINKQSQEKWGALISEKFETLDTLSKVPSSFATPEDKTKTTGSLIGGEELGSGASSSVAASAGAMEAKGRAEMLEKEARKAKQQLEDEKMNAEPMKKRMRTEFLEELKYRKQEMEREARRKEEIREQRLNTMKDELKMEGRRSEQALEEKKREWEPAAMMKEQSMKAEME